MTKQLRHEMASAYDEHYNFVVAAPNIELLEVLLHEMEWPPGTRFIVALGKFVGELPDLSDIPD